MKQLLLGIAFGVLIFALAIYLYASVRSPALADADRELTTRASMVADSIDQLLQTRMIETFTFAALPSFRGFAASDEAARPSRMAIAQSELQSIVASDPAVDAASIADTDGRVILTTDGSMYADWSERPFVQEGLIGHLHASVPARDFDTVVQYYSAPILDNSGNVAGVLVLRVAAQELWNTIRSVENALIVDENGVRIADNSTAPQIFAAMAPLSNDVNARVLAEKRYGVEITQIRVASSPTLANQIKSNRSSANFSEANGTAIRAAIRRLETNPWSVIVMVREDAALAPGNAIFWQAFGAGMAATMIVGLLVYVARYGTKL